jgi:hypothetical protein
LKVFTPVFFKELIFSDRLYLVENTRNCEYGAWKVSNIKQGACGLLRLILVRYLQWLINASDPDSVFFMTTIGGEGGIRRCPNPLFLIESDKVPQERASPQGQFY